MEALGLLDMDLRAARPWGMIVRSHRRRSTFEMRNLLLLPVLAVSACVQPPAGDGYTGEPTPSEASGTAAGDIDMAVLAPTGAMQAYLRVNRVEVGLSFLEDRVVYRGPAGGYAFEQALGFDLSAADAAAMLLGYGIADGEADRAETFWDAEARRIRVETRTGTLAWLHPPTQRFDRLERADRRGRVTAEITEWLADPAPLPRMLTLEIEPEGFQGRHQLVEVQRLELGEPHLDAPAKVLAGGAHREPQCARARAREGGGSAESGLVYERRTGRTAASHGIRRLLPRKSRCHAGRDTHGRGDHTRGQCRRLFAGNLFLSDQ